ncbi:MaoC/PaaZ C-terminal domain-containing protein [Halobacillus naozhouensis]|uniref:MaoC/PaaZ C-terminal domain-containing protein n=1 Tax=Halobacillus naozhouensis TaxID=554880 RepID=A0ABY8IXU6_9BACI|nr:MaoC/PaaZ C-terminal domain-containing protein [Halobacillus naozhouensis]WFT74004.1 MaoC/PaaZ C-terminal domain-containing protein [Halobacillus naozhouensis]
MSVLTELAVGESLQPVTLDPVSRLDLIKYAGASGDYNPIHTIDEEAEKAGLPGIIAHGMWTMGNLSKLFTPYYEEGFIEDYTIRFKGMVFLNDEVTLHAVLIENKEEKLNFDVKATNQDGKEVIKGNVAFRKA